MKNNVFLSLLLFVVSVNFIHAQPGPYGTDVHATFKDEQGNFISISNSNYDIKWITWKSELVTPSKLEVLPDTLLYKTDTTGTYQRNWGTREQIFIKDDTVYIVDVRKTPAGGGIRAGAHFMIIKNNTDNMRLYPPVGHYDRWLLLDDIYFRQGNYYIPNLVYAFHSSLKKEYRNFFRPNLYDDWDLFRIENHKAIYKEIIAERVELFENHETASKLLNNLSPYSSDDWFYKKYFDSDKLHHSLRGGMVMGDRYHVNEDERDENDHELFGVLASNIFIYQKVDDSPIEYGYIKIPIDITGINEKDSKGDIRFKNLTDFAVLNVSNLKGRNSQDYYTALGYYSGIRQYFENRTYDKPMWGFYKIHISPLSAEELKRIAAEHAKDNNLYIDEEKARELYNKK